ncbi:NlpC/P60 family protein [Streptomyces sp. NPDC056663]|uniref:C40 family peptidase n=1 Tax=Streptomyces sp. NPDC056663 TaxID=3345899 RepID=UPI0036C1B3BF
MTPPSAHAAPEPATATLDQVRQRLNELYGQSEVATEKYNAADEKARSHQKKVDALKGQVKLATQKETRLKSLLGAAARAQYRGAGVPAVAQFLLSSDPENALASAALARQAEHGASEKLEALETTRQGLRKRADKAAAELEGLRASRRDKDKNRAKIEDRIATARALESQLEKKDLRRIAELDKRADNRTQNEWVDTGVLNEVGTEASAAGRRAIAYASQQLGKPYVWGAEGPDSFDCSGLTSQAWLHAGVAIPRTSEEQWAQLKHVPVSRMRPGDLIIYYSDAHHVAIYTGGGKIIQAPRTGRPVYVSPAGSMPILGVVRPDA